MSLFSSSGRRIARKPLHRTHRLIGGQHLEAREQFASDLYIDTIQQPDSLVEPGQQNVVGSVFTMSTYNGRPAYPHALTFPIEFGSASAIQRPELWIDDRALNARGGSIPGSDGVPDRKLLNGTVKNGSLVFNTAGIAPSLTARRVPVPLHLVYDVARAAPDGMEIGLGLPAVTFSKVPALQSIVGYQGEDNPVHTVDAVEDSFLSIDFISPPSSFSPQEDNIDMGTLRITADDPTYVTSVSVAISGRHADGTLIESVDNDISNVGLYDYRTGEFHRATRVATYTGLAVYRAEGIFVEDTASLQVRMDHDGPGRNGDEFGAYVVTSTGTRKIDIAGLSGPTNKFNLRAQVLGNDRLIVRPSGVLGGNPHTVDSPKLVVSMLKTAENNLAVANERGLLLGSFLAYADSGEDLVFKNIAFAADVGSFRNLHEIYVMEDIDGDGRGDAIVDSVPFPSGASVAFDDVGIISAGTFRRYDVYGRAASSLPLDRTLRIKIDPTSVQAEEYDVGDSLPADHITVFQNEGDATLWNFVRNGSLYVTGIPVESEYLLGSTRSGPVMRLMYQAFGEDIDVTDNVLYVTGDGTSSIDRFEFVSYTTTIAAATVSGVGSEPVPAGGQSFWSNTENRQFIVPENQVLIVDVYARVKSDEQGGVPGTSIYPSILATPNFVGVRARGAVSSNTIPNNNGDQFNTGELFVGVSPSALGPNQSIGSNWHDVVMSKFSDITNADPNSRGTAVPTGLAPIVQMKVWGAWQTNTSSGWDVSSLGSFVTYVNATNVQMDASSFTVYSKADPTVKVQAYAYSMNGTPLSGLITGNFIVHVSGLEFSGIGTVGANESDVVVVEGMVTNPDIVGSQRSSLQGIVDLDRYFEWVGRDAMKTTQAYGARLPYGTMEGVLYQS